MHILLSKMRLNHGLYSSIFQHNYSILRNYEATVLNVTNFSLYTEPGFASCNKDILCKNLRGQEGTDPSK